MSDPRTTARVAAHFAEAADLLGQVPVNVICEIVDLLVAAAGDDRSIFIIGNGGSAATADHFATDLSKNAAYGSHRVRAVSLVSNVALMTALANDLGYSSVFAEQLATQALAGDMLVAISGSGNSPNILAGAEAARARGMTVIGLVGFAGGHLRELCDHAVVVGASSMELVEDVHMALTHAIAVAVGGRFRERQRSAPDGTPAVFVDRDGVVNVRRQDHVRSWEEFEFAPGAVQALALLSAEGKRIFIVTNQAVIGRDGIDRLIIDEIHERALAALAEKGARIEAVLVCPHDPRDSCACRKPRPGLLVEAAMRYGVDLAASVFIGDSLSDITAGRAAGCRPIFVGDAESQLIGVPVAQSLLDAVERHLTDRPSQSTSVGARS